MSLLRTDLQAALNELHVRLLESKDYYRDAAEFLAEEHSQSARNLLEALAEERYRLAERIETAIRETGDLPSVPDTDRETGHELLQKLEAVLEEDKTEQVIIQRKEAEEVLQKDLQSEAMAVFRRDYDALYGAVAEHVQSAITRLNAQLG